MSARTRTDYILWGALGCALVATYHAEYTLAVAAGFHPYVALAVPGALDLYVIRALQQRRDVLVAVLAMVAANVASHLIAKDVLQVGWQVIAAVGAIAPLVLWRVYSLKHTRNRQELLHGVQAGALEYTGEVSAPGPTPYTYDARTGQPTSWTPAPARTCPDCGIMWDQEHENWSDDPADPCPVVAHPPAPDRIPDWMDREYPVSAVEVHASAPPLPALPPEYPALTEDEWDELSDADREFLPELNEYIHSTDSHTLEGLRKALGVGQARGQRLIKHARKEGVW